MTTKLPVLKTRTHPVIETFGPTVQGEGVLAGLPTYFVRFGGCDYRCSWCDSMYAVEPALVRANAEKLTTFEIVERLGALPPGPEWVTLSGGNPALHDLDELLVALHHRVVDGRSVPLKVAVETQGSVWRSWLGKVDSLTVSPKPPSSGMTQAADDLREFVAAVDPASLDALKIVVFDETDYEWARDIFDRYPEWSAFLSVGTNPVGLWGSEVVKAVSERQARDEIGQRYAWLADKVANDPAMSRVRVLPQLHVIAWGHAKGV